MIFEHVRYYCAHTSTFVVAHAIMSLTATRNKPPVSGDTVRIDQQGIVEYKLLRTVVDHCDVFLFCGTLQ